jgi:hypothetical protein
MMPAFEISREDAKAQSRILNMTHKEEFLRSFLCVSSRLGDFAAIHPLFFIIFQ